MTAKEEHVRRFVTRHLGAVTETDDIFARGVSSMFALELIAFIEATYRITIESDDLELDNFRSVSAIERLVARKQQGQSDVGAGAKRDCHATR